MAKNKLAKDLLDVGIAAGFGGISAGIIQESNLPQPVKTGASGLIGVAVLKKASKKFGF